MEQDIEYLNKKLKIIFKKNRIVFKEVLNKEQNFEIALNVINNELLHKNSKFEYKHSLKRKFVVFKEIDGKLHIVLSQSFLQGYSI